MVRVAMSLVRGLRRVAAEPFPTFFCNGIPRQFPLLLPSTAARSLWDRFSARFDLPTVHRPYVCCRGCNEREHAFQICITPSFQRNNVDNNFLSPQGPTSHHDQSRKTMRSSSPIWRIGTLRTGGAPRCRTCSSHKRLFHFILFRLHSHPFAPPISVKR